MSLSGSGICDPPLSGHTTQFCNEITKQAVVTFGPTAKDSLSSYQHHGEAPTGASETSSSSSAVLSQAMSLATDVPVRIQDRTDNVCYTSGNQDCKASIASMSQGEFNAKSFGNHTYVNLGDEIVACYRCLWGYM